MREREAEARRPIISLRQFLALAALVFGAYFAFSFGSLVLTAYRLNHEAEALRAEIEELRAENDQLQTRVAGLREPAAVEDIARTELGWTRPGETQVVVSVEPSSAVILPHSARATATPVPNWQLWASLFLQSAPEPAAGLGASTILTKGP